MNIVSLQKGYDFMEMSHADVRKHFDHLTLGEAIDLVRENSSDYSHIVTTHSRNSVRLANGKACCVRISEQHSKVNRSKY